MDFETPLETICRIIVLAQEWDAQVPATESDDIDENETMTADDDPYDVMIDEKNEAVEAELQAIFDDLAEDQLAEVLALAWVGRGTFDASDWSDAIEAANDGESDDVVDQLMDMPMLAAYLEAGLAAFDLSCDGVGQLD